MTYANWQEGFTERLEAALPIEDLVAWLIAAYPGASERDIKGMLQKIYCADYNIRPADSAQREYRAGGVIWKACPQRVAASA